MNVHAWCCNVSDCLILECCAAFQARRTAREQNKQFIDVNVVQRQNFVMNLPESLHPHTGVMQPLLMRIYEDFARGGPRPYPTRQVCPG